MLADAHESLPQSPVGSARWVREVLSEATPPPAGRLVDVRVLRGGAKRLAVLTLDDSRALVLKQYADDRGASTLRWLRRLTAAGFAPPSRFGVTAPRGWSGTHRTLVTDVASGHPWTTWLLAAEADRAAAAVAAADWLIELQSLSVRLPDRTGYRAAAELRREIARLAGHYPGCGVRLHRLGQTIGRQLHDGLQQPIPDLVASHGDLHPENLFLTAGAPSAVTAIDVDTAGLRRPSYDAGYVIAQLLIVSWMHTASFQAGAGAARVFWERWAAGDGTDAEVVPAQVARALVQSLHFELVTYRTGRVELIDRWLGLAEAILSCGVTTTLSDLTWALGITG